jgi:transcriptional regulator with XRE-family HTH domain
MSTKICTNVRILPHEMREIGNRFRTLRRNDAMNTQATFGFKYGISERNISYIESGERLPGSELLYVLRKDSHDLNDLMAPVLPESAQAITVATDQTSHQLLANILGKKLGLAITEADVAVFAEYCAAPETIKFIIQSVLHANNTVDGKKP